MNALKGSYPVLAVQEFVKKGGKLPMMHKTLRGTIKEEAYIDLPQKLCASDWSQQALIHSTQGARGTRGRASTT